MLHMHTFKHLRFLQLVADIAWSTQLYTFLRLSRYYMNYALLCTEMKNLKASLLKKRTRYPRRKQRT
ncbi:hypothetical protein SLEP1_g2839 [Rubroshorea leprosula]|uniref:Uncharacterized protein n=1 Tax=Rubroshorea leprosula TaxID=152421 RepID=A0AAV5HRQ9_9ROSI|nr:hypothetical protein SLEP1_g2839 [Rubroshorea leprosula]